MFVSNVLAEEFRSAFLIHLIRFISFFYDWNFTSNTKKYVLYKI